MNAVHKRLQSKTILVVDDDESTLKWLVRVLRIYFKEVYSASDAMQAFEVFKQRNCDVIIADIQMPEVDGLSFLQKINTISPSTLRVVMTAFNSTSYLDRAVESGVYLYLKKPIDVDELLVAISSQMIVNNTFEQIIHLGENFIYDVSKKMLYKDKEIIKLTKKELLLFELLIQNKDGFVTHDMIEQNVWQEHTTPDAIRMVIVGLRKKLYITLIENLKGLGYRLNIV